MSANQIFYLKQIIEDSSYTVAISGSRMLEECGIYSLKSQDLAFKLESKYGFSPERMFTNIYFTNRTSQFYKFFREEILSVPSLPGPSAYALAAMERAGRLQSIITGNIYDLEQKAGCKNVIHLHGTLNYFICPHCKQKYTREEILNTKGVPHCRSCGTTIRPELLFFGEMIDSHLMTRTTREIEKADVLLLLETTIDSELYANYIKYFSGSKLVIIHEEENRLDYRADLVILDRPMNVLPALGYQ
ncbi:Sir2 family NAD-dependent protein deacetylase [Wansuia hejianensis]|uniref:protein acetyllysine N-acetyltransferase n=1 Tax=Wansuia hejianensis TaxID=2763667 RepID=A0A7G9GAG9_9FIRM|nr:Sir2 family NAD-dependent protein deacetylase [Wansuia hejianensis]QNM07801.1 NAD-dependent deacetylase [Wansuia hejianensis]